MLSLRTFARSVPRTVSRSVTSRSTLRPLSTVPRTSYAPAWKQASKPAYAAFSTSSAFRKPAADGDVELIAKFEDELGHEKASGLSDLSSSVKNIEDVLARASWDVKDAPGEQEVVLSKKFGNEEIRLNFSISDVRNMSEQDDPYDNALADEEEGHQAINQGHGAPGSIPQHAEDRVSPADREMDGMESEAGTDFPVRVNVTIEKPGGGALLVQTVVQNGYFQIEDLSYFAKPDLAHAQTAEKDWARQALYAGPPFENLDEALQGMLDRYLEERGIHSELATMIPDYIQVKEQKEYVSWLENIKNFVSA